VHEESESTRQDRARQRYDMNSDEGIKFRGLEKPFFDALKEGELKSILDFEWHERSSS